MHLFLSVGEPSGDLHASKLIEELRRRIPGLRCSGFGGPLMQAAGCEIHYRLTDLAVMGILAVIPLLWRFVSLLHSAGRFLDRERPDAVLLVDFPGFNWWIARLAKRRGIPVYYYLPPQLWAWAPWRIRKMRRLVDQVLCCLPFEDAWYRNRNVPVQYVGHPFFDEVALRRLDQNFLDEQRQKTAPEGLIVGILPGSRNIEIDMNFNLQLQVMANLHRRFPNVRFLVASYRAAQRRKCEEILAASKLDLPIEFHVGRTSEVIELAHVCLMVSGSVSLELLARSTPAVVIYRSGPFHYWLGRLLITCRFISLPNLMADHRLLPEFVVLGDSRPDIQTITGILETWLSDPAAHAAVVADLRRLRNEVAVPGATARAATAILERLTAEVPAPDASRAAA
ncbi:MAG TPA: lipid-A-disaccharide synthase [Planctomycetaceae bacterium]|nr:lipid-A-disaccharide synthase [Planctomycetaceae bacterium]